MEKRNEHQEFIEDLILNMLDVFLRHEEYHDIALSFQTELELNDNRILTVSITGGDYEEE